MIKKFFKWQIGLSQKFNMLLPKDMRTFGTYIFNVETMPKYIDSHLTIYDIGGGKHPNISTELKSQYALKIIGMDIDDNELRQAPEGLYDKTITADITAYHDETRSTADLIICRALLEHVHDTQKAIQNIATMLKPGGKILIFVPCSRAWYSYVNRLLPEEVKLKLLSFFFPDKMHEIGFKAYYDRCTPKQFKRYAKDLNLKVRELQTFYNSRYFEAIVPLHIFWRLYQLCIRALKLENFCETSIIVYEKLAEE